MRYGIIDLGSNTIRLAVYDVQNQSAVCLCTKKKFSRAVSYRRKSALTEEGIGVMSQALLALTRHAGYFDLSALWCFATASLRGISNQTEALAKINAATGLDIEVLSEEREAALGVSGFLSLHHDNEALIADLGGGSLELSLLHGGRTTHAVSLPIGSASMAERHVSAIFPDNIESKRIADETRALLQSTGWLCGCHPPAIYAMGGSARALFRLHRALSGVDASLLSLTLRASDLEGLFARLLADHTQSIRLIDRHCPGRLTPLLPGFIILREIMQSASAPALLLCAAGLREGYLSEKLRTL